MSKGRWMTVSEHVDVEINLDDYKEDIIEYCEEAGLLVDNTDKYNELRDLLHYGNIDQEEFMARLDEMMSYKRNGQISYIFI